MNKLTAGVIINFLVFAIGVCYPIVMLVTWDDNLEPDIVTYRIYYGLQSRNYCTNHDLGMRYTNLLIRVPGTEISNSIYRSTRTNTPVVDFPWTTNNFPAKLYFAATAVNAIGLESDYSPEVELFVKGSEFSPSPPLDFNIFIIGFTNF